MIDSIVKMLSFPFMQRAFIAGIAVALTSALIGVPLVLRRYSMIGDGLSHVGFGALSVAAVANIAPLPLAIPTVLVFAFILLGIRESSRVRSDAAIAVVSTGALAVGVVVIPLSNGVNTDVYSYMFGSIFALTESDAVLTAVLSLISVALFILLYDRIFLLTFDGSFARSTGIACRLTNAVTAAITAVTIVLGMRMMGALMITALTTVPAITSVKLCRSFRGAVTVSAAVGTLCAIGGVLCSYYLNTPPGASVVLLNIAVLTVAQAVKTVSGFIKK